jgi:hypothetical protein
VSESLSRTPLKIIVEGVGEVPGEFVRFLSPLTVEALLNLLPFEGRAHPIADGTSFIIGIGRGGEKGTRSVKAGTIAYWPMQDSMCIFYTDTQPYGPVNRVGHVTGKLDTFRDLKSGVKIRIEKS